MKVPVIESIEPAYYTETKHEVIDIIDDWGLDFLLGNVLKYIHRAGKKSPTTYLEDLKKAYTYLGLKIARFERNM